MLGLLAALVLTLAACTGSGDAPGPTATAPSPTAAPSPDPTPTPTATPSPTPTGPTTPPEPGVASPPPPRDTAGAWVAVEDAGRVVRVDLADGRVTARHRVGPGPHNLTVAGDGTVAACLYGGRSLAIVADGEVRRVTLGGRPHDVKAAGDRFVVTNEAGRRIDVVSRTGEPIARIDLDAEPHDLAVTPDGSAAWVTLNDTDRIVRVDIDARRVTDRVATGQRPHDIRIGADGRIWLTDWRGPLHVLDPSGRLRRTLRLGREAHHLALTPDGTELWLVDHALRRLFVVDTADVEVVGRAEVPGAPHHVAITASGRLAAVADHTNGTVAVYDTASRELLRTIPVGPGPHGVWQIRG